jgi:hypothetical protein
MSGKDWKKETTPEIIHKKSFGYFEWGYFWRDIFFKIKLNECFVVATIGAFFLISVTTFIIAFTL